VSDYQDIETFGGYQLDKDVAPERFCTTQYACPVCGCQYETNSEAMDCASHPISENRGVGIGDVVRITRGDGRGEFAKVIRVGILSKYYGHYQWEKLWHTIYVEADLIESFGTRMLSFDNYEVA